MNLRSSSDHSAPLRRDPMNAHRRTSPTTSSTTSNSTANTAPAAPERPPASRFAQARALAGAEWKLLLRNKVALLNTLLMPGLMVVLFAGIGSGAAELSFGAFAPTMVLATALIFVVYYTLVTALVARREASVLQRLRTGEASDATILVGLAAPFVVVTFLQTMLTVLGASLFLGVGMPANIGLIVLATVGGIAVWTLLGIASTGMTRSVEHAQITTLPAILVPLLLSGVSLPLQLLPEAGQRFAALTPLHPVVELMRLGMAGIDANGVPLGASEGVVAAIPPFLVLVGWIALGAWLVRRYLRWVPRR